MSMAIHHLQSPMQKLGCLTPLSLGEFTALVQHKSDDTVPGSNTTKALSIHSSHLTQWLLGLYRTVPGDKKKKKKKGCSVRRRGFQAILPLEVKIPRNRLLKLNIMFPRSKSETFNFMLFAFLLIYICIFRKYSMFSSIPHDCPILLWCTAIEWLAMS